jgi:hypothetical protein
MVQQNSLHAHLLCIRLPVSRIGADYAREKSDADAIVEELAGDYNSPTLLVNGFDVTGRPRALEGVMSCRLDLPTEE